MTTPNPNTLVWLQDNQDMTTYLCLSGHLPSPGTLAMLRHAKIPLKVGGVRQDVCITTVDGSPLFGFDVENDYVAGFDHGAWSSGVNPFPVYALAKLPQPYVPPVSTAYLVDPQMGYLVDAAGNYLVQP